MGLCRSWGLRLLGATSGGSGGRGARGSSEPRKALWRLSWEAPLGCRRHGRVRAGDWDTSKPWATGWDPTHLEKGARWELGLRARRQTPSTHQGPPTAEQGLSHGQEAGWILVAQLCLRWEWPVAGEDFCRAKWRHSDRHKWTCPERRGTPWGRRGGTIPCYCHSALFGVRAAPADLHPGLALPHA